MMKITLVMSAYNGQRYIKQQLDSIFHQTLSPDEVIIRDDCSSDETTEIISNFIKSKNLTNWSLSINKKNIGYKENFYRGVMQAKGDYIFLCDQDDIWLPNKIEKMTGVMEAHTEINALNCAVKLIDGEGADIKNRCEKNWTNCNFLYSEKKLQQLSYFAPDYILRHNIGPGCAMVVDRKTADCFLRTYSRRLPHDWHMNLIAAVNGGCAFLNEPLICYRCHDNNAIGANTGIASGMEKKTNDVRIDDYRSRLESYKSICDDSGHVSGEEEQRTIALIESMIEFYKNPCMRTLNKAKSIQGYKELAKRKVQMWEMAIALHADGVIKGIAQRLGTNQ